MEDYQREAVIECLINSYSGFEPLDVTDYLLRSEILDDDEETKIRNESVPWTRVQLLVSFVEGKAENVFDQLLKALTSCGKYDELAKDIQASAACFQKFNTKVEELLHSTSLEESYMYLDMLLSVGSSLGTNDSLKICKHLSLSDECIYTVRWSENPGLVTMNFCRNTRIVKVSNVQALRDLLNSLGLVHQLAIVDRYFKALEHPEIELLLAKTEPDILLERIKTALQDKIIWFKVGKQIGNMFQKTYAETRLANIELDSCFLTLKVPSRTALKYIHRDACSEKLASDVLALLLNHVQHHDLHDTGGRQNMKLTFELNEHIYRISKSHFEETEEPPIQDNSRKKVTTEIVIDPSLTTGLGPEVTVTITKTFPDSLLASLRRTVNDRQCSHTQGRSLRIFFHQYFEGIFCTKIRDGSNGVSFFLKVKTATALHRLHTVISKGELAEEMLATVQDAVDKHGVKHARMVMELNKEEYKRAQEYFASPTASGISLKPFGEAIRPKPINQGSPTDPLLVDPESFEMIQQLHHERQEYENSLLKSGKF